MAPIDKLQIELSEKFISPYADAFENAFYQLRMVLDDLWLKGDCANLLEEKKVFMLEQVQIQKLLIGRNSYQYPLGRCFNITKIAFSHINKFELNDANSPFFPLNEFVKQGGAFKVIWGEVRHEVFQTSMQIGNWYFDCANDTVSAEKPKVLKFTFDSIQNEFHEVSSVEQYIAIKKPYHECDIYFNNLFPAVNKLFPLLIVRNNKILIDESRHVSDLMIQSDFSFLMQHSLPQFPEEQVKALRTKLFKNASLSSASWLFSTNVDVNQRACKEVYKTVKQINFILRHE